MTRPTEPPHDGQLNNPNTFQVARANLGNIPQDFETTAGTPFIAEAHIDGKGQHEGHDSILIKRDGEIRAYIYECCWGHITNCNGTYIDSYTPIL